MRRAVLAAAILFGGISMSACSSGPACLKSHAELMWMPTYNPALKMMTMQMIPYDVCDQYAKVKS